MSTSTYSLDIQYDHLAPLNYRNLFLILKWYSSRDEYLIKNIYINSSDINHTREEEFNLHIYRKVDIGFLKKIKFFEFKEWYSAIKDNDFEYVRNTKYYGFKIVFDKNSICFSNKDIYPKYP